jgi:hypothetical protein
VAVLKLDVAGLKTEMTQTKEQLGRLERSTSRRFDRIDADVEGLRALIKCDELKN